MTPGWKWYHQPFNAKIPATSCYTQNSKIPLKRILPFFSQIHEISNSLKSPNWPHLLLPKAILWQLSQLFLDSCDSFFRTAVTVDLAAWALLIFPHLAKTKTNYWNYLSLAKIFSFSATFSPAALTWNSKNTLKLNIPFLAKS